MKRLGVDPVKGALLLLFVLYSLYILPTVSADKDSSEFTLVLATFGMPHPTGYPIYTILGGIFVNAAATLGLRWDHGAGLFSMAGSIVALLFAFRVCGDLCRLSQIPRDRHWKYLSLLTVILAVSPVFSYETTSPEVYTWHLAWVAFAAWVFVRVIVALRCGFVGVQRLPWLALQWGMVAGLGLSHHATSLFFILPCSFVIFGELWNRGHLKWSLVLAGLLGSVIPVLSYLYVAYRAFYPTPHSTWFHLAPSWASVWAHITGAQYRNYLGGFNPHPAQWKLLWLSVFPLIGVFLPLGLWALVGNRRNGLRRALTLGLFGGLVCMTMYGLNYNVYDPASYFLAPMLLGLISLPLGWSRMTHTLTRYTPVLRYAPSASLFAVMLLALPAWHGINMVRKVGIIAHDQLFRQMWDSIPDEEAFVFWPDDMVFRLTCFQVLEGSKPQIQVYATNMLFLPAVRERMVAEQGIDPWAGLHNAEFRAKITESRFVGDMKDPIRIGQAVVHESVNVQTELPVILFDPERRSVRRLKKWNRPEE